MNETYRLRNSEWWFDLEYFHMKIPFSQQEIRLEQPFPFLMSFGSSVLYIILVTQIFPLFKQYMNENKRLATFSRYHYGGLFLFSLVSFLSPIIDVIQNAERKDWIDYFVCSPLPEWLRLMSIMFTVSKMYEWVDTAILVWRGESLHKMGFLHIYHHATTFFLFLIVMNMPGSERSGMLLNGFVHTLMYYHFAFRLPRVFRPIITTLQIIQLIFCTYLWHINPSYCDLLSHSQSPSVSFPSIVGLAAFPSLFPLTFFIPNSFVPVYCLFFFRFFFSQYIFPLFQTKSPTKSE